MGLNMLALLLLAGALAPAIADFECGIANSEPAGSARIVNGQPQTYFKYPWFAVLHAPKVLWKISCAGALISPQFVLTAAHCFNRALHTSRPSSAKDLYHVTLGIFNQCKDTPGAITYKTTEVFIHPRFVNAKEFFDIALMKLDGVSELMPVCLPSQGTPIEHVDEAHVAGFGRQSSNAPRLPCKIHEAIVEIFTNEECQDKSKYSHETANTLVTTQVAFCAGKMEGGTDTCQSDSGGSILVKKENRYFSMGIVSYGMGCGREGYPGIYTNVASFVDWINDTMHGELEMLHLMA